jgi:hypothetical protein
MLSVLAMQFQSQAERLTAWLTASDSLVAASGMDQKVANSTNAQIVLGRPSAIRLRPGSGARPGAFHPATRLSARAGITACCDAARRPRPPSRRHGGPQMKDIDVDAYAHHGHDEQQVLVFPMRKD